MKPWVSMVYGESQSLTMQNSPEGSKLGLSAGREQAVVILALSPKLP